LRAQASTMFRAADPSSLSPEGINERCP
jgi:hypothetical protein